jgi:uncharacterized phage protein (TIGR01671 family)
LFRGKGIGCGEWVEGFYYRAKCYRTDKELCDFITIPHPEEKNRANEHFFVIPETVGQYTGLTDKNGKKIFEGDIVKREFTLWHGETKKTRETQIGVVVYSNRECRFEIEKKCNLRKPWDGDTQEVIGNIYDNPELLEESNENQTK